MQINKIWKKNGDITTDMEEIQRIIRSDFENMYCPKLENIKIMDIFLDKYHLPNLNQDQTSKVNRPIIAKEIETVIKFSQPNKAQGQIVSVQISKIFSKNN